MSAPAEAEPAGYLGPAGTFSEEALLSSAAEGRVQPVALASIAQTVLALLAGEVRWAVVPIENSLEGSIGVTLDLLAGEGAGARIVGETRLHVRHSLIAPEPVALEEIRTVFSHPAVPGQCSRFLRGELAQAELLPASSTAEAVRAVVAAGDRSRAALGTVLAAEIYGGAVIRAGVEDRADNETRFAWLARAEDAAIAPPLRASGGERRCAVVFWGAGAKRAGWLVLCLDAFAKRGINLTKIESRPQRSVMGAYMFFAELEGDETDDPVAEALAALADLCEHVAVLGSYAAAEPGAAATP
ncbi:MAG TPA: prephenate dehydratase [Solirubrobacteraceae bacterium]